jgi:hypothetical protein
MFYPGSGSWIPKVFILYVKRGMKNKSNLFLAPYGSRSKYCSKKINKTRILKIIYQNLTKKYPLNPGSEIGDPEKFIPYPGGKKPPDPDPQHCSDAKFKF